MIFLRIQQQGAPKSRLGFELGTSGNDTAVERAWRLRGHLTGGQTLRDISFSHPEIEGNSDLVITAAYRVRDRNDDQAVQAALASVLNRLGAAVQAFDRGGLIV